jgi:hypothetical protein
MPKRPSHLRNPGLIILALLAGVVGLGWLCAEALGAVVCSAVAAAVAHGLAQAAIPFEILLFALWLALRPLSPLFPLFGIPTDFPLGAD